MSPTSLLLTTTLILLPLISIYLIYKPPHLLIRYFQYQWPDILWHVPQPQPQPLAAAPTPAPTKKLMALTIDDSPSKHTCDILHVLKSNNATATFFVIGDQIESSGDEAVLRDLVCGGNELANHAMHDEPSFCLGDDELREQVRVVQERIEGVYASAAATTTTTTTTANNKCRNSNERKTKTKTKTKTRSENAIHPPPKYFRPGSGFFHSSMRRVLGDMGYRIVLGDVYPHDPMVSIWWVNAKHILSMLRPGGIIVCHDRREWTVPMLGYVLPEMKRRGYRVVTVTELLEESSRGV